MTKFSKQELLLLAASVFQFVFFPFLLSHQSDGAYWQAYSFSYLLFLAGAALLTVGWMSLWFLRQRFFAFIAKIPSKFLLGLILLLSLLSFSLIYAPIELIIQDYMLANWFLFAITCLMSAQNLGLPRRYLLALVPFVLVVLVVHTVNALTIRPYAPDEALWADIASSLAVDGGLHLRTGGSIPFRIMPGIGWVHGLYAFIQGFFDWDLRLGRVFNLVIYGFGILGMGWFTKILYGRTAAIMTLLITIIGGIYFRTDDYRPDHFLILSSSLAFVALAAARKAERQKSALAWHFGAGLIATLGMQLHAAAITFIIGISLFYLLEYLWGLRKSRQFVLKDFAPVFFYGLGAGLGTGIYLVANVFIIGGLNVYLANLLSERNSEIREFSYFIRWSALEMLLILAGFAMLIWRRNSEDRFYLGLALCVFLGIFIADTQGYILPYRILFLPPIGAFFAAFFTENDLELGKNPRFMWIGAVLLLLMACQGFIRVDRALFEFPSRQWLLPEPQIESLGRAILPYLRDDETLVASHELIWVLPERLHFYSPYAEGMMSRQQNWQPEEVWENLAPDVYVQIEERMETPVGLAAYLESENFIVCDEFRAYSYDVRILRRVCS